MRASSPKSSATIENLTEQMSRGSVLNDWDAVLNISEDLVNRIFQAQFEQTAQASWKNIVIAFCQAFPDPSSHGKLAVYTGVNIALKTPALKFLGDNQPFVEVSFKATGRTGAASTSVPAGFDPKKDANPDASDLEWEYTSFSECDFTGRVPLSQVTGSTRTGDDATAFVLDFPSGSFMSPMFDRVKDPDELRLQLKTFLQTHEVQYVINTIQTTVLHQMPQMAPRAFRIAALTTNENKNIFQIFIATENPARSSLTIGANEPIPDGYSLSAMFNQSLAGQLKESLMQQVWLFMESNLAFPGRTDLRLGPQFTPCDALILGTLEVDTSPDIPPIDPPKKEKAMLNIQKTQQIKLPNGTVFTAYGDDVDPNAWYIPPKVVWAKDSTGLPLFSLIRYNLSRGAVSGFCRFSVELAIDPAQEQALKAAEPNARITQFDWIQSGAIFTYTIDGQSTSVRSQPSNFGSQTVTFCVPLADQQAVNAFINAFSTGSGAGTFAIHYELAADTRLPAVTVVTTFNSAIAYQYQLEHRYETQTRYHTDTWGHHSEEQVQVYVGDFVHEMLTQTQAGKVTVTPGEGLSPALLDMVQNWANVQLRKDVEAAVSSALSLIKNPTNDFSMNSVASFTHTLETTNVVPWYFTVEGPLPPFVPETWPHVYSEMNQQNLEVVFAIQEDLAKLGVKCVNMEFQYGDPPARTFTFDSVNLQWHLSLPGLFNGSSFVTEYKYRYEVIYAKPAQGEAPPPLSSEWIPCDSTSVKFGAVQLGLLPVTFEAANIGWGNDADQVKEITVDWSWIAGGGGPVLVDSLVLTSAESSATRTLRSTNPTDNQAYQYSLTFLMGDGTKLHAYGLTSNKTTQRISAPLSSVEVSVLPLFPEDAKAVVLRATFDDEFNDTHLNKQWTARPTSSGGGKATLNMDSFAPWDIRVVAANLNMTTVVFSGNWVDRGNKQHAIPKTLLVGSNNTLIISDTQKTVTAVIDASNVMFAAPRTDGVYRVVALVSHAVSPLPQGSNPLADAQTITFDRTTPAIQYYPTDPIDIADTPTFFYQYEYTENIDGAKGTKVTDLWAAPQSTVSTALPVIPGTPAGAPQLLMARAVPHAGEPLDPRTEALLARHTEYCLSLDAPSMESPVVVSTPHR